MSEFALTHSEVILSTQLDVQPGDPLSHGWQEIRTLTFHDHQSLKTVKQRVRAEIGIAFGDNSYGSIAIWASSTWKPIARLQMADLPPLNREAPKERDVYAGALKRLFEIAAKVIG